MKTHQRPDESDALQGVNRFVLQVLSSLAPQDEPLPPMRRPMESYLAQMTEAVLHPTPQRLGEVVKDMRHARISTLQIAEAYVPTVARRLGDDWLADRIDFAAVSIGSARLQGLLRRLGPDWGLPRGAKCHSPPAYIVGVPDGVQHTMGATVLAGQLRHRGLSVHLDLEMTVESLAEKVGNDRYSGILISASAAAHLEPARKLVECAKNESRDTPVIIGGIVLDHAADIKRQTKADLVTSDVYDAMRHCDISRAALDALPPYTDYMRTGETSAAIARRAAE